MLYNPQDTIAAISTPPGVGATGIIRISGPDALSIAEKFFSASNKKKLSKTPSHTIVHGWITDSGLPVDEVMVSLMLGPRSYTGEDTVEISAHAGPVILERILKLAVDNGARLAGPGEFTFRAYINGKLDLAEAEAVADLISSKTALALDAALSQLRGNYSSKIREFRKKLVDILSLFEAALDHSEEGIEFISDENMKQTLQGLVSEVSQIIKTSKKARFLREGLKTVIVGKPNAGKSSLLNALLERERAIVTDVPGTTRDVLEEIVDISGLPVILMDTAGIRAHSQDPAEKIGQNRTLDAVKNAQLIIWVLDSSTAELETDRYISETLKSIATDKVIIPVWNKSDMPFKADEKQVINLFPVNISSTTVMKISAKNGTGISGLENALVSAFSVSKDVIAGTITANARHIEALCRSEKALKEALVSIENGYSEEIPAMHVRDALSSFGEITGETATDEILENIFKNFCVGK
jgi:tRNA modification GTPase